MGRKKKSVVDEAAGKEWEQLTDSERNYFIAQAQRETQEAIVVERMFEEAPAFMYGEKGWNPPNPMQVIFHESKAKHRLAIGAQRSGKTVAVCAEIRRCAKQYPGFRWIVCKRTMSQVRSSIMETLLGTAATPPCIPREWVRADRTRNPELSVLELKNGSKIVFGSLTNRVKWGGTEYSGYALDDVTNPKYPNQEIDMKDWEYVDGRLSLDMPERIGLLTTNPPRRKDHWLYKVFMEPEVVPNTQMARFLFKTRDNSANLPPDYEDELRRTHSEEWIRRYLEGEPVYESDGPGAIQGFDDVPGGQHVSESLECIKGEPIWVSWDFGYHHPAVTVHQLTPSKRPLWRILFEELGEDVYLRDWAPIVMAKIVNLFGSRRINHVCDHSGNQRRGGGAVDSHGNIVQTEVEVLNSMGIYPESRPTLSELEGLHVIQDYVYRPGFLGVHSHCELVVAGMSGALRYKTDASGRVLDKTTDDDYVSHVMDTVRYFAVNVLKYQSGSQVAVPVRTTRQYDSSMVSGRREWEPEEVVRPRPMPPVFGR